jgi:hypothetical protein
MNCFQSVFQEQAAYRDEWFFNRDERSISALIDTSILWRVLCAVGIASAPDDLVPGAMVAPDAVDRFLNGRRDFASGLFTLLKIHHDPPRVEGRRLSSRRYA